VLDETWSRSGNLYFASGHVNIVLGRPISHRDGLDSEDRLTIDFLPPDEIRGLKTRPIEERTVVAMFLNNRAAEALAAGRVADAYWLSREAIEQASDFLPAYNTLGVVYLQNGATADAEQAFAWALQKEPDNRQAMANMVTTLRREGRDPEADKLKQRLASLEPEPPYHFFNLGIAAFQAGDFSTAQRWFAKEVDRASYNHEFHFWLAMAELRLGELNAARRELKFALDNSTTRGDHDLYAAKLGRLNAMRRQQ
jgi:Tfp pilus assembly protein PilF